MSTESAGNADALKQLSPTTDETKQPASVAQTTNESGGFLEEAGSKALVTAGAMLTANQGYEILQDVKAVNADRERWHSRMSLEKALESRDVPVPNLDTKANGRRNAPSGESQSLSHEFLQQMIGQKLALAKISHAIIDRAYGGDPDPDAIESTIRSSSEWQILPEEVKSMAQDCLELYRYNHQQVENYRATYPNDRQLYRGIFHRRPKGKVKVVKGPITLNFICDNKEDYTYIVSQNWLDETPSEPTKEDKDYAIRTGGVHLQSFGGIINAENNALRYRIQPASLEYKQSIQIHENQHANYQLLTSSETSVGFIGPSINWYQELQQSDKNVQRQRIHGVLTQMRNRLIDTQVKDELLAYIADGYYDEGEILKILFESKSKGGLYDYASSISSSIEYELKRIEDNVPGISNNELLEISTQVFVKDYQESVSESLTIIHDLVSLGLSKQETIALLTFEPLTNWRNVLNNFDAYIQSHQQQNHGVLRMLTRSI